MKRSSRSVSALLVLGILAAIVGSLPTVTAGQARTPTTGQSFYVDASKGSDANPGTESSPFRTITKALSVALPGGPGVIGSTIQVAPGLYDAALGERFPLVVPDGVTLIGDEPRKGGGPAPTVISGGGPVLDAKSTASAVVAGFNATIAGFTLMCAPDPSQPGIARAGLYLGKSGTVVRNNTIRGSGNYGVLVDDGGGGHALTDNLITGQVRGAGVSVKLGQELANKLQNNVITGNEIGVKVEDEGVDLGGGDTSSKGGNTLVCNTLNDLWVRGKMTIEAKNNVWAHNPIVVVPEGKGDLLRGGGATVHTTGNRVASGPCGS